jgi:hypothetical protein
MKMKWYQFCKKWTLDSVKTGRTLLPAAPSPGVSGLSGSSWWCGMVCRSATGDQPTDNPKESRYFFPGARWRK